MDFVVLFGGAFFPLMCLALFFLAVTQRRPRRFFWLMPLMVSNLLFALAYASQHRWGGVGTIWWNGAGFAALLGGMVTWVLTPRSQR